LHDNIGYRTNPQVADGQMKFEIGSDEAVRVVHRFAHGQVGPRSDRRTAGAVVANRTTDSATAKARLVFGFLISCKLASVKKADSRTTPSGGWS